MQYHHEGRKMIVTLCRGEKKLNISIVATSYARRPSQVGDDIYINFERYLHELYVLFLNACIRLDYMCLYVVISAKVTKPRNLVLINNDIKPNGPSLKVVLHSVLNGLNHEDSAIK